MWASEWGVGSAVTHSTFGLSSGREAALVTLGNSFSLSPTYLIGLSLQELLKEKTGGKRCVFLLEKDCKHLGKWLLKEAALCVLLCLTSCGSSAEDFSPMTRCSTAMLSFSVVLHIFVRAFQKPSGSWSKTFKMKLKDIVGNFFQNRIALNFIATIILAVIEEITEREYTCAPPPWNLTYFIILLVLPFFIFFILNFIIQRYMLNSFDVKKNWRSWLCILWQCSFPPCMWIVIVFLDGRYFQCAMSTDHDASIKLTNFEMSAKSKVSCCRFFPYISSDTCHKILIKFS